MANQEPIAICGMSYRAPGIGRKGLWDYLAQARSAWTRVPADRFEESAYFRKGGDRSGVMSTQGAHFIDEPYGFDAAFFNMRAEEAKHSDPQHRLMLEVALEAAEDAGLGLQDIAGKKIGVFVGSGQHEYAQRLGDDEHVVQTFSGTGNAVCMAANRVSYFFDIDGPSVVSDAACASSVYAAHVAVNALRNGECNAAFVGTASLNLSPAGWLVLEKTGALSEHGRSYSYDSKASGFGRGEGAACLFIKRMEDAIRDGDPIQAVIRGTACNHSGRSDGITMPNGLAQQKLLWAVHNAAGLDPSDTPVIEGHGTGTGVGDPIESGAFTAVLGRNRTSANPLHLGSIKSNFGHLEGASGALAMVKAIMQVKNGIVLPTAGFENINPKIQDPEKVRIAEMPLPWPENEPRRCLITNFGFGGSNSAIIIEKAPEQPAKQNGITNGHSNGVNGHNGVATNGTNGHTNGTNGTNGHSNGSAVQSRRLFTFSAKTQKSLDAYLTSWDDYLDEAPESSDFFRDLSYTLGQRRTHFPYRVAAPADSVEGLQEALSTLKPVRVKDRIYNFVFTGQGAQYARMALELKSFKVFADALEEAESHLQKLGSPWSLLEELNKPAEDSRVNEAELSQPACTCIQLALVTLLTSWGIVPTAVTGHSSGEIAAAFAAGLVSFQEAVAVAYFRGQAAVRLSSQQSPDQKGGMLALGVGAEEATKLIDEHGGGYATVAAVNSFNSVTISGDKPVIEKVFKAAEAQGTFARKLNVEMAYHSRHMEQVAGYYLDAITPYCGQVSHGKDDAQRPIFVSSVTGQVEDSVGASYWIKNLVRPVLFANAVQGMLTLFEDSDNKLLKAMPKVIVEVGPHAALKNPIKQTVEIIQAEKNWGPASFTYVPTLVRGTDAEQAALDLAATLYTLGAPIQLGGVNQTGQKNARVLTELPSYAWDKTRYELRPRATHEKFCPGEDYHPLIGRKMPSSGGQERAYRQVFTLDEMPWIRDHVVGGSTIFPMTGYMSCAIEAARRTVSTQAEAFLVTDFHVSRSLEVLEEQTVDLVTKLRPAALGEGAFSTKAWSFEITTWAEKDGWTVHCWGQIEPEMAEMTMDTPTLKKGIPLVNNLAALDEKNIEDEYAKAAVRATQYGPSFKNNIKFYEGDGFTVLEHRLRDLGEARTDPFARGSPVSVDPPTIDGFLQGGGPLQYDEQGRRPAQMPNYISRFRVSNKIPSEPNSRFDVVMQKLSYDVKGGPPFESSRFRNIGSAEEIADPAANVPDNWAWEVLPKFDYLPADQLRKKVAESVPELGIEEDIRLEKLGRAGWYYIGEALKQTAGEDYSKLPHHYNRFIHWAARAFIESGLEFPEEPTELLNEVRSADAQGLLCCAIGENLVDILHGEVEPLEIMLTDNRLTKNYENGTNNYLSAVLGYYAEMLADLEPNQRILEIGAGTAGSTLPILEGLSKDRDEPGFMSYTFTDVSTGFFEGARTKLEKWTQRITYKKLDITEDPVAQGFALEEFDVVVAANVLHATPDMISTIANVRSLLKPGGKLLLLEGNVHNSMLLPFTLMPGWWLSEDKYREHGDGPMMTTSVWNQLLLDSGFSGVDTTIPSSWHADVPLMSVISSTRIGKQDESRELIVSGPFVDDVEQLGCTVDVRPVAEIDADDAPYYIFIDSLKESIMQNMTHEKFEHLQNLILHNTGLLYITPEGANPDANIILGMLRTVRMESDPKNLTLLQDVPSTPAGALAILKAAERLRDPEVTRHQDQDLVWKDGSIHFPRMLQLKDVKEQFAVEQNIAFLKNQNLWGKPGDRALEMTIDVAGSPDTLYFRRTEVGEKPLGDDEVIVRVEAAGLSHRDLEVVLGAVPWAPPGFDGCGKVIKTGSRVSHVREGDDVFFLSLESSALATYKQLPSWQIARIPAAISITNAATMPLAYSVAVLALIHTARTRKGETVLVHAATGAVGQACITLAQHLGATVFATAGTESKRDFLHTSYGIPKDRIFSSRTPAFRDSVMAATGGRGIDVLVNSLSGELLTETWALAAPYARFVEVGNKDTFLNNSLPMRPFNSGVTFAGIDLRDLHKHRPDDVRDVFAEVVRLVRSGVARPIGPLSSALKKLKSSDHSGKIVVTLGPDESFVAETPLRPSTVTMNHHATYVVTGGTRGIGLELAYWLIEHGARYIVVLGRSGAKGEDVQKLLAKYADTDVTIRALACNVGKREELAQVMESISDLPPVKGVVHSALLLSDKLFVNATYEDWEINTTPRVHGAWNLHELMPAGLDFFIALSSFSGDTGNIGQAIYAGTAGFYDAFAKYRNKQGQYTVSIALPVVLDVGYVVEHNITELLKMALGASLTMADIRALFKCAVSGSLEKPTPYVQASGRATAFKVYVDGQAVSNGSWKYFHPVHTKERLAEAAALKSRAAESNAATGGGGEATSWTAADDPEQGLTEALITKVAAMTMMEREEVLADAPLDSYNLDSLVSVELRNWIRRETTVELTLSAIMHADSLRALAAGILAQRNAE
ncbi:polyketide synthase [Apiospora hydei]|uniref:Polyketide synthase n=1 Tax=Apiospora hydei TaxID=1337664 RepID=A0ABR1X925_9PEZI